MKKGKKVVLLIVSAIIIIVLSIGVSLYIKMKNDISKIKDIVKNCDYEVSYEANDFLEENDNEKLDKLKKYIDISLINEGVIKGEKYDKMYHGNFYQKDSEDSEVEYYSDSEDVVINVKNISNYLKGVARDFTKFLGKFNLLDDTYISLKKIGVIDKKKDKKSKKTFDEIKEEAIKNARKGKMPESSIYEDKIKDMRFVKTKIKGVPCTIGLQKEISKDEFLAYIKIEKDGKEAEGLVKIKKAEKKKIEMPKVE